MPNTIMRIDLKDNYQKKLTIKIISPGINDGHRLALSDTFDKKAKRDEMFEIIRNKSIVGFSNAEDSYNSIADRVTFRKKYTELINNLLRENYIDADIVIFPEYAIPKSSYQEIVKYKINKKLIIIAGSHIDNWFNVSPIIFNEDENTKKIYFCYKNNLSPFEKDAL